MQQVNENTSLQVLEANFYAVPDKPQSVWTYKLQRFWLTPVYRSMVRVGIPAFLLAFFVLAFVSKSENRVFLYEIIQDAQVSVTSRPDSIIQTLTIEGASPLVQQDIRKNLFGVLPTSDLELDLLELRQSLEEFPTIESAVVFVSSGGLLQVQVNEIPAAYVWRGMDGLKLVSSRGNILRNISNRAEFEDLPLIAGNGAIDALQEVDEILKASIPITSRLRGLVRIGQRRWNLVLVGDQTIALPEDNPSQVLSQIIVLSAVQDLFERDIIMLDFRNPKRPTLRLRPQALVGLKEIKGVSFLELKNE